MYPLQNHLQRNFRRRVEFKNTESLFGPRELVGRYVPPETAGMTQPLCFGQIGFAAAKLLSEELVVGNIYRAADILFPVSVVDNRDAHAANVADRAIRSHDALGGVERRRFIQDSLDHACHGFAVARVDAIEVFLNAGSFASRIESVNPK